MTSEIYFHISWYTFTLSSVPSLPIQGSRTAEQYIRIEYEAAMRVKHGPGLRIQGIAKAIQVWKDWK